MRVELVRSAVAAFVSGSAVFVWLWHLPEALAATKVYESEGQKFRFEELAKRDTVVWGFDFLPDGRILFTERSGRLSILDPKTGKSSGVSGVPKVAAFGQGGLLDVRVHPEFTQNGWVYLSYSEPTGNETATTAVGRAQLKDGNLEGFTRLFSAIKPSQNDVHFGSRIEFDGKGHIFFAVGDRNERAFVQDLSTHIGKMIRLKEDGTVPKDNPFVDRKEARPEIWSLGHRSPQGLTRRPGTDELWEAEMGPRGGDEVNLIRAGANYGWPVITFGREYYGLKIGEGTAKVGMEQPVAYWVPSISPSGIAFYTGQAFPKWQGDLFLATLSGSHLRRLKLKGTEVIAQEELLKDLELRFRNVRAGPDGLLYVSTDDGRIARLKPAP